MAKGSFSFLDLEKELDKITNNTFKNREQALDEASDYLVKKEKENTPVKSGKTKDSWERSTKYKGVRYINNSAVTGPRPNSSSKGIPIINLLEFSSKGKPFVRKTFDNCKSEFEKIFIKNLNKGE